jgi:hypothetical protein
VYAEMVTRLFERTAERLGLVGRRAQASDPCTTATFQRPATAVAAKSSRDPAKNSRETTQLDLFGVHENLTDRRR